MFEDSGFGDQEQSSMFPFLSILFCTIGALMIIMFFGSLAATLNDSSVFAEQKDQSAREESLNQMFNDMEEAVSAAVSLQSASKRADEQQIQMANVRKKAKAKQTSLAGVRRKTREVVERSKKAKVFQETQIASAKMLNFRKQHTESRKVVEKNEAELKRLQEQATKLKSDVTRLRQASKTPTARLVFSKNAAISGVPFFLELKTDGIVVHSSGAEVKTKELISTKDAMGRSGALLKVIRYVARPGSSEYLTILLRPRTHKLYTTVVSYCKKLRAKYTLEPVQADWILNFENDTVKSTPPE